MTTKTIETRLLASIERLGERSYSDYIDGYQFEVYLDPEKVELYTHEGVGNIGTPMGAFHGRHVYICDIPEGAIPSSVVNALSGAVDMLVAIVEDYDGDYWDGSNWRGKWKTSDCEGGSPRDAISYQTPIEFACYWQPCDWFEPAFDEVVKLADAGKNPTEIVDELGCGDDYTGEVDRDAAIAYITERLGEVGPDGRCLDCGKRAEERECFECEATDWVIDCGHYEQPAAISAGRNDGSELDRLFCTDCGRSSKEVAS